MPEPKLTAGAGFRVYRVEDLGFIGFRVYRVYWVYRVLGLVLSYLQLLLRPRNVEASKQEWNRNHV